MTRERTWAGGRARARVCARRAGFGEPRIVPYHALAIDPSSPCLHYGVQCFEGMKAYKVPARVPGPCPVLHACQSRSPLLPSPLKLTAYACARAHTHRTKKGKCDCLGRT